MILTRDNYYTPEADREYMSCSQFEDFERCEAAALAKIRGEYTPAKPKAFIVGNYFHTYFEGVDAHENYVNENAEEIFLKRGGKKAEFRQADEMIASALADPFIRKLIEKQFRGLEDDPAFWLVCISKEDPPDKELVAMNDKERQEYELSLIEEKIEHIQQVKKGEIPARRCGKCAYCRRTKKILKPVSFWNIAAEEEE